MYIFIDMCFLCLEHHTNIQSVLLQDDDGILIEDKLKHILTELINFKPEIPKNICPDCLKGLNYVYKFRQKCLENLSSLRDYFKSSENKENYFVSTSENHSTANIKNEYLESNNRIVFHNEQIQENYVKENVVFIKTEQEVNDDTDVQHKSLLFNETLIDRTKEIVENNTEDDNMSNINYDTVSTDKSEENVQTFISNNVDEPHVKDKNITEELQDDEIDIKQEPLLLQQTNNEVKYCEVIYTSTSEDSSSSTEEATSPPTKQKRQKKIYKCTECSKTFAQHVGLQRHKRLHTGEKPYKCNICNKAFSQKVVLKHHQRTHSGEKPNKCDICEKSFITLSQLQRHKLLHSNEKTFKCDICDKEFTYDSTLSRHIKRTHAGNLSKPFTCDQCGKAFITPYHLKRHIRTHSDERPYACDLCEKTYKSVKNLKEHKMTHSGEKPFSCEFCPYKSITSTNLKSHIRSKHAEVFI